ncbi:MAG: PQQ-binding-like beta-propeller repeat protein, partial [Acidobacteriota bacterium]|nr:PQQ-binding-like beta-propeller repeat protein [Acidobacteriota bacterium]
LRTGPEFEVLAENDLDDYVLSSPAVSEGQIFIRTTGHLYAIGDRRPAALAAEQGAGGAAAAQEAGGVIVAGQARVGVEDEREAPRVSEERTWSGLAIAAGAAAVLAALVVGGWRWGARRS